MEGFACGPKVHLHENSGGNMLHVEVSNGNCLNDGRGERVIFGREIVEEYHSTESLGKI